MGNSGESPNQIVTTLFGPTRSGGPENKDLRRASGLATPNMGYVPQTPFWKLARARLVPVVEIVVLPLSLLEAFHRTKDPCQDWGYLLRFLSPLSVPSSPLIKIT